MIRKAEMMDPVLEACPGFGPTWDAFLKEWSLESDLPVYIAVSELARYLIATLALRDVETLRRAFAVVERWHLEGDQFVREAATVGLLEDLQNTGLHDSTDPVEFEPFLLPTS